jgi:hypothetical protein
VEVTAQYAAGALLGLLTWWLESDAPLPPEELAPGRAASSTPPPRPPVLTRTGRTGSLPPFQERAWTRPAAAGAAACGERQCAGRRGPVAIPVAAGALYPASGIVPQLELGALAMGASPVTVVTNAPLLRRALL